jgi:hypothetical protein
VVYTAILCGGKEYKVLGYEELRMAQKPSGEYVLPNGWLMYEHIKEPRSSILIDPNPKIDFSRGRVLMVGKKNESYICGEKKWRDLDGDYTIKVGDIFVKNNPSHALLLEDGLFHVYPKHPVFVIQRKDIMYVLNG